MRKLTLLILAPTVLLLTGYSNLFQVAKPPVEVAGGPTVYLETRPGEEHAVAVRLAQGAEGARVFLRLSDPCAQGKAVCPGWDTTRYPGVEHTREAFTLTASNPEATFRFRVAQDALPQGPFKWEVVAEDAQGKEWTTPVYLRILTPGDVGPLQAINHWREMVKAGPFPREDLERGFGCWQYGRYRVKNWDNPDPPHTTDPNKPFYSPEADLCARTSHTGGSGAYSTNPQLLTPRRSNEQVASLIAVPIHRLAWLSRFSSPPPFWYGEYQELDAWPGVPGGMRLLAEKGMGLGEGTPQPREVLFPPPNAEVPLRTMGGEWPDPIEACNATQAPKPPYRSAQATWSSPVGLPITVTTSVPFQEVKTQATYARLLRTRDGAKLPVCALGSEQFWNQDQAATNVAVLTLKNYGTLIVVPKDPLDPGEEYEVEVKGLFNGKEKNYRWRFRVATGMLW